MGFGSQRPEPEIGKGPDNLWAIGELNYVLFECKSGAVAAPKISKKDTNQMNGSIVWFEQTYDATCKAVPIIVHPKTVFENAASPHQDIRIVTVAGLTNLKNAVRAFSVAVAQNGKFKDPKEVERQLKQNKLDSSSIVDLISVRQR